MTQTTRRNFFTRVAAGACAAASGTLAIPEFDRTAAAATSSLKIGIVTYEIAKDWDIPTIIKNCTATKYDGVELRAEHAHGVELGLSHEKRAEVRKRFADSPVKIAQMGSTYEFHSVNPEELRKNIEGCKQYIQLAEDVGAPAVKVRPNGLQTKAGIPVDKTLEQIGRSLGELGKTASDHGVEIRLEVHGPGTSKVEYIQKIMEIADHPKVVVNWNSNSEDLDGGLEQNFARVSQKIRHVHMRDLFVEDYPWRKLVSLLIQSGFSGYCCAEIPQSPDPLRVLRYFRALFIALQSAA